MLGQSQLRSKLFSFSVQLAHTAGIKRDPLVLCSESVALQCISLHFIAVQVQFYTLWCSRGALVGSGYGTPYGGQDMAGGEKQCSRSRGRNRRKSWSWRKDER